MLRLWCAFAAVWASVAGSLFAAEDAVPAGLDGVPEVVAKVDSVEIRRNELIRELVGSSARSAIDRLVKRQLVEQAAAKAGVKVTEEELDAQLKFEESNLKNELRVVPGQVNERTFEDLVRSRFQMSVEEYKNAVIRQQLLAEKSVGRNVRPTEADLKRFFAHRPYKDKSLTVEDVLQPPIRYRAAHILITPLNPVDLFRGGRLKTAAGEKADLAALRAERKKEWMRDHNVEIKDDVDLDMEPEWQACLKRAQDCMAELTSKKITWEQAVEKYSQDPHDRHPLEDGRRKPSIRESTKVGGMALQPGEVGWFTRDGPMVREFYEGAKDLRKKDELAGPVRTQFGYHIIRLIEDVDVPPRKTYEELRPQVERIYISWVLQALTDQWLETLMKDATVETTRALLWYPDPALQGVKAEADPVVLTVNGAPLKRSEVWRELLRSDGPEALDRLINREMALGPLRRLGPSRLEWEGKPSSSRSPNPPPVKPVDVSAEDVDRDLTEERLALDRENEARLKKDPNAPTQTLDQFVRENYGQSLKEFMRALEAGVVLSKSVRRQAVVDEGRLVFEFYLAQDQYREPVSFYINQIVLRLKPDADHKTRQDFIDMAGDLRKDFIDKRKTWADIAALVRDPNDPASGREESMILTSSNEKYPEIYDELAKQNYEKGQVSEPIVSRFGVHLIQIVRRIPARLPDFSEVRDRVERDYLRGRAGLSLDIWLRSMKNQAKVERFMYNQEKIEIPETLPLPKQ
ncbi:MAG: peptidylprolyl isomerase [Planctomycetes bacterium]|nr:peptidylprolyl isomerase [Planctomycetota bacterium]